MEGALEHLNKLATRGENSKAKELVKLQLKREEYFDDERFSKSDVELLFSMRTKMTPGIKRNFSSQYGENIFCDLCKVHVDCQEHLLRCVELKEHVEIPSDVEYSDIFKGVDKQLKIVKVLKQLLRTREVLKCEQD